MNAFFSILLAVGMTLSGTQIPYVMSTAEQNAVLADPAAAAYFGAPWRKVIYETAWAGAPPATWPNVVGWHKMTTYNTDTQFRTAATTTNGFLADCPDGTSATTCQAFVSGSSRYTSNAAKLTPTILGLNMGLTSSTAVTDYAVDPSWVQHNCVGQTTGCAWQAGQTYATGDTVQQPGNTRVWQWNGTCGATGDTTNSPSTDTGGCWTEIVPTAAQIEATFIAFCTRAHSMGYGCLCNPSFNLLSKQTTAFGGAYGDKWQAWIASGITQAIAPYCDYYVAQMQGYETFTTPWSNTLTSTPNTLQYLMLLQHQQYINANPTGNYLVLVSTNDPSAGGAPGPSQVEAAMLVAPQTPEGWYLQNNNNNTHDWIWILCLLEGHTPVDIPTVLNPISSSYCPSMPTTQTNHQV